MLSNICPNGLPKSMKISFVGILYEFFSLCIFNIVRRCILTFVAYVCYIHGAWLLKEGVKYYFADFVCKGGNFSSKRAKNFVFCSKKSRFLSKNLVTDLGDTPLPPFTDKIRKVVFAVLPKGRH